MDEIGRRHIQQTVDLAPGLVEPVRVGPLLSLLRYSRPQALVAWSTFVATLALSPRVDQAVLIGIGLAVFVHLWRELRVHVRTHFEGTTLTLKPQGVLFFASAPGLDEALIEELAAHPSAERLIVDLSGLGRIDFTGALVVKALASEAEQAGLTVEFTAVPPRLRPILSRVLEEKKTLLGSVEE